MLELQGAGRRDVRLRQQHPRPGAQGRRGSTRSTFPDSCPSIIRPLFCEGKGPFRWVALSGDPEDIRVTDEAALELFGDEPSVRRWIELARERVAFQGLPARILLARVRRTRPLRPARSTRSCGAASVRAPIVIGRDHLDAGSVASPTRETENMRDGSDAIADWPVLNALLNASSGATWVSVHHGGGVGIGYSLHAGMVIVADGTAEADEKLERVLTCDPGIGVLRHADAGYPEALAAADARRPSNAHARGTRHADPSLHADAPHRRQRSTRRRRGSRCSSAAAAAAARRCCTSCATASAAPAAQYVDVERTATTPERFLRAVTGASPFPPVEPTAPTARPRRVRSRRSRFLARTRARRQRAGDVPARRVPRAADVRELPGPAPRAARPRRRPGGQRQPLRPDQPLHGAHAPAAARPLGALRSDSHAAAHRRGHARHPRPGRRRAAGRAGATGGTTRSSSPARCRRSPTAGRPTSARIADELRPRCGDQAAATRSARSRR